MNQVEEDNDVKYFFYYVLCIGNYLLFVSNIIFILPVESFFRAFVKNECLLLYSNFAVVLIQIPFYVYLSRYFQKRGKKTGLNDLFFGLGCVLYTLLTIAKLLIIDALEEY